MKKIFVKLSMLLFVLVMSTTAWAGSMLDDLASSEDPDVQAQYQQIMNTLNSQLYCARLTGHASSTGGGKVYVNLSETQDPREATYVEGTSNVAVIGMGMSMAGLTQMPIAAWAKADDGYYLAGWSYANMGTDLGTTSSNEQPDMYYATYDISLVENETIDHVIYATFEPIRFKGYSISEDNTTSNSVCALTVTVTMEGTGIDAADFKAPTISDAKGGGTWAPSSLTIDENTVSLTVTFTAPNDDIADYSATLVMETQAGVKMNVYLYTRTTDADAEDEAIRYNSAKEQQEVGDLSNLLNNASDGDIIKLLDDYDLPLTINKDITLDLNGFDFDGTLSIGGDVTIPYSPFGGKVTEKVTVATNGKLTMNGGSLSFTSGALQVSVGAEAVINGATVVGLVINQGTLTITDGELLKGVTSTGTLTINGGKVHNTSGAAVTIDDNMATAIINRGSISGSTYGVFVSNGSVTIEKLAAVSGDSKDIYRTGGTVTVNNGKFSDPYKFAQGDITFHAGYFQTNNNEVTDVNGKPIWRNTTGTEFRDGYKFFAGDVITAQAAGVSVCHIGATSYSKLEDALAYVNNTNEQVTIVMDNDYTLPAGYYTLPANAILLVPMSNEQGAETKVVNLDFGYTHPTLFRKLTFEDGVNLDVFGTIEVSGSQYSGDDDHTGATSGAYGQLQLNQGSKITLQNGSILRAWGYVTGDIAHKNAQHNVPTGEIDARRGATVYELFQMGDWGNTIANGIGLVANDSHFPISCYYIQNVEAPVKYHPGAHLIAATTVSASGGGLNLTMCANDIKIIGVSQQDVAMFLMNAAADAENTWVRKWYDASKDQQVYEINSGAHIGNLVINLASSPLFDGMETMLASLGETLGMVGGVAQGMGAHFDQDLIMNSGQYVLPITSNFKLHALTGTLDFTQSTELIPGSELEIDKEATVLVTDQDDPDVLEGSLYVFDWQDWAKPAKRVAYTPIFDDGVWGGEVPDEVRSVSSLEVLGSAKVNVHGTFDTKDGYVFTSEHGGNIFSSIEDAGTFIFTTEAKAADYYEGVKITTGFSTQGLTGETTNCYPAYLKNGAEWVANGGAEYVHTGGTAAGQSYCYLDIDGRGGHWMSLEQRGCFTYDNTLGNETYYIKPQEYVAVVVDAVWDDTGKEFTSISGNDDHTFSDAAGAGRLFISLTDENGACQWWEVEQKDNYYHCIHPQNDTYYEWNDDDEEWQEVKFTITWKDWDGSTITTYTVPYGTQAEWLSTNPTRAKNLDYTYDFTGWSPELGKVTNNVTYTATYEKKQIKYTIAFIQDGGVEIERHLLARDEMPVCENEPTRTGYILQWEPALGPVTGNQTYTATWLPEPPPTYTITFKNYNGTQLEQKSVTAGDTPEYTGEEFSKPATSEYSYKFAGWKPALAPATTNATYVAQYNEEAKTYEVKFYNEDESSVLKTQNLQYGATPTPPTVSKSVPGHTCTYVWKTLDGTKTIETVTANASYKPVFTETPNKYTVTLQCNVPGACSFTGAGIYDYGTENVTIAATINDPTAYEFVQWTAETTHSFGSQTITEDVLITVMVKQKNQTPEDLTVGIGSTQTIAEPTNYMDVVITSNGTNSGQIINANNITLYGNADFKLVREFAGSTWYCVAVPWRVNVNGGILLNGTTPAVLGQNIDICYYDGSVRAAQGKVDACWVYMRNLGASQQVLQPGRAYMIALRNGASSITFRKKIQEPLLTTGTSVRQYNSMTGNDADAGWNGIANPSLFHAYLNAGTTDDRGQRYLPESDTYDWFYLNAHQLVVGEPVYVQAPAAKSIVVANGASYAPARRTSVEAQPTSFDVNITATGAAKYADHISVSLSEDKEENKYVIGQDLVKFGVSTKVAQMWINRYDAKLCVNTIAPEGDVTTFPMSIYAPKAGEYTIAIEREENTNDYALYLTYNGEAIWNLSDGAYTLNLNKGTISNYGLRVSARAPQVTTGVDEAIVEAQGETAMKVLINNQVFIIRGNRVYSVDGQLVK